MLSTTILLHCVKQLQNERSISAIYHIFRGKKSIQTIQDARLYQIENYLGIYPTVTELQYSKWISAMEKEQWIERNDKQSYILTKKGSTYVTENSFDQIYLNGKKFRKKDEQFFKRFILTIQLFTHINQNNVQFIPIVDDKSITSWVKCFYNLNKHNIRTLLHHLFDELTTLYSLLREPAPSIFVDQLTSAHFIGLTSDQLARKYNLPTIDIYLHTKNVLHYTLVNVINERNKYPILFSFINDLFEEKNETALTQSANMTYELMMNGLTPEQVAQKRNLKLSTIHDHIVEIALHDESFPIENYISEHQLIEIQEAMIQTKSWKLKDIKNRVSEEITYFQIRLALTKLTNRQGDH